MHCRVRRGVTARGATRVSAGSAVLVMRILGHLVRTIAGRLRRRRGGDEEAVDDETVDGRVAPEGNDGDDTAADAGAGSERASGSSSDPRATATTSMSMMLYNPLCSGSAPDVRRGVAVLARHPTTGEPVLRVHDRSRDTHEPSPLPLYEFRRVAPRPPSATTISSPTYAAEAPPPSPKTAAAPSPPPRPRPRTRPSARSFARASAAFVAAAGTSSRPNAFASALVSSPTVTRP